MASLIKNNKFSHVESKHKMMSFKKSSKRSLVVDLKFFTKCPALNTD